MSTVMEPERVDAFGRRMVEVLNHAGLALMTSIGHRTGLFDVMSRTPAATSAEIAAEANLNERYVREWLGAMTTGGVVEYDENDGTYRLPPEHAAWLTREASPNNVAVAMQFLAVLGRVEDHVVEAFNHGRGVPYSRVPPVPRGDGRGERQTVVAALFEHILPLVPGLVDRLAEGIDVLDVGCGSGRALNALAARFPSSRFTGCDAAEQAVAAARDEAARRGLTNVHFELQGRRGDQGRGGLRPDHRLRRRPRPGPPRRGPAEHHPGARPGGLFLMQEISGSGHVHTDIEHPLGPFLYTVSCMHCMSVSLANGGPGLGAMWGKRKALEMLGEAGFGSIRVETLPHDLMNEFYIAAPS